MGVLLSALAAVAATLATVLPAEFMTLTLVALAVVSGAVACVYRHRLVGRAPADSEEWLLHGIAAGFLGTCTVSVSWVVPWALKATGLDELEPVATDLAVPLSAGGRSLILWAGVCHLVAAYKASEYHTRRAIRTGLLATVAGVAILSAALVSMAFYLG